MAEEICSNCNGEGMEWETCCECDGDCTITDEDDTTITCPYCDGTGEEEFTCPDCYGSGYVEIDEEENEDE